MPDMPLQTLIMLSIVRVQARIFLLRLFPLDADFTPFFVEFSRYPPVVVDVINKKTIVQISLVALSRNPNRHSFNRKTFLQDGYPILVFHFRTFECCAESMYLFENKFDF